MEKKDKKKRLVGTIIFFVIIVFAIAISKTIISNKQVQILKYVNYHPSYYDRLREEGHVIADSYDYLEGYLNNEEYKIIDTYDEYALLIEKIHISNMWHEDKINNIAIQMDIKFNKSFFKNNNLIIVEACSNDKGVEVNYYKEKGNSAILSIIESWRGTLAVQNYYVFVPASKKITSVDIEYIKNSVSSGRGYTGTVDKPIIYLYPETEQEVSVKVGVEDRLTCTYPKYNKGWNVIAKPNGDLIDVSTGRNLYALYWEGIDTNAKVEKDGFVIKGEDSIKFLEEKLAILGLSEREAEEFIVYWLPKLEANKYNYIRFETAEEIEQNMPLIINPTPDTIIRIVMNFKGLDKPIEVEEQELFTPQRKGFTVVEWGGTEIK